MIHVWHGHCQILLHRHLFLPWRFAGVPTMMSCRSDLGLAGLCGVIMLMHITS